MPTVAEFVIVVMTISTVIGSWVPTLAQPHLGRTYDTAAACEDALRAIWPLPGTRLVCMARDPPSPFDPTQGRPPFPDRP